MIETILKNLEPKLKRTVEFLISELGALHTGKASPALVDNVLVETYGTKSSLKTLASITVNDPKTLAIQPWDQSTLTVIEKSLREANFNVVNLGNNLKVILPPLNEDRRKELVKIVSAKAEEAKISIRNLRHQAWEEIEEKEKRGLIAEDEKFRGKESLQKLVDRFNQEIEELTQNKEKEVIQI